MEKKQEKRRIFKKEVIIPTVIGVAVVAVSGVVGYKLGKNDLKRVLYKDAGLKDSIGLVFGTYGMGTHDMFISPNLNSKISELGTLAEPMLKCDNGTPIHINADTVVDQCIVLIKKDK